MAGKINSKRKGKRGELEAAKRLRELGFENVRRSQQYCGAGASDLIGIDGMNIEVKRAEKLNIYEAVEQAVKDAEGMGAELPVVMYKKNRKSWLMIMRDQDWARLVHAYLNLKKIVREDLEVDKIQI